MKRTIVSLCAAIATVVGIAAFSPSEAQARDRHVVTTSYHFVFTDDYGRPIYVDRDGDYFYFDRHRGPTVVYYEAPYYSYRYHRYHRHHHPYRHHGGVFDILFGF